MPAARRSERLATQAEGPYNRAGQAKKAAQPTSWKAQGKWPPKLFMPEIQYGTRGEQGYKGMNYAEAAKTLRRLNSKELEICCTPFGHAYKTRNGGWFLRILYDFKTEAVRSIERR